MGMLRFMAHISTNAQILTWKNIKINLRTCILWRCFQIGPTQVEDLLWLSVALVYKTHIYNSWFPIFLKIHMISNTFAWNSKSLISFYSCLFILHFIEWNCKSHNVLFEINCISKLILLLWKLTYKSFLQSIRECNFTSIGGPKVVCQYWTKRYFLFISFFYKYLFI